jgi:hypothetical protein
MRTATMAASVTRQRSNQPRPQLVFLPLSGTRLFSGFRQVQSIRPYHLFQPLGTTYCRFRHSVKQGSVAS